jgi:hypothetical protein
MAALLALVAVTPWGMKKQALVMPRHDSDTRALALCGWKEIVN